VQWLKNLRRLEVQINRIASKGLFREPKEGRHTLLVCLADCFAALEHLEIFQLEFCKDLGETKYDFVAGLKGVLEAANYDLVEMTPNDKSAWTLWTVIWKKAVAKQSKKNMLEDMEDEERCAVEAS